MDYGAERYPRLENSSIPVGEVCREKFSHKLFNVFQLDES